MLSNELQKAVAPFAFMLNSHALSPKHRSLLLAPNAIRAESAFGLLEAAVSLEIAGDCLVDGLPFLAIVKSMPSEQEVFFELANGALSWYCGKARGKLAVLSDKVEIRTISRELSNQQWKPSEKLLDALSLGALSCGSISTNSLGLYGITLDTRYELVKIYSSDNLTCSMYEFEDEVPSNTPDIFTFSQDSAAALEAVLSSVSEGVVVDFDTDPSGSASELLCVAGPLKLLIKSIPPVKQDVLKFFNMYDEHEICMPVDKDRISAFLRRVDALTETKGAAKVSVSMNNHDNEGVSLQLAFEEGTSSSEEYYVVTGVEHVRLPELHIEAKRFARALAHVTDIVLDHADRHIVVLRSDTFRYMMTGSAKA